MFGFCVSSDSNVTVSVLGDEVLVKAAEELVSYHFSSITVFFR